MKKGILSFFAFCTIISVKAQTISQVRNLGIGQTVTVTGVATNGSELGNIRYIQDGTAGIACYGSIVSSVQRGDSITATGVLFDFSGLLELSPTSNVVNHGAGVLPQAQTIPFTSATEALEAQLVRFDNVTFVQTGNFATGNSTVQVSNGTATFDVRVNGSTNIDGTAIPTGPITIVGELGQFNANYQIIPRNLLDIFPYVAPAREINVKVNGNTVLNNDTYVVGTTAVTSVTIENTGVSALTLSGVTFSGANAAEFGINLTTGTVAGLGSNNYSLTFTPTGTGTRTATISIANNDSDENPYIINLYAIGTNNLATEPTTNPTNLTFPLVKAYTVGGQYTAGTNADNYIVLWKNGAAVTGMPTDGTSYKRGDVVGDARVAYIGSGTGFTPRGIIANQNYYFTVYAFNGPIGFENYKTTTPATGNATSQGEQIGNYYSGISSGSTTFLSDLSALINPHTVVSYFNYKTTLMNQFEIRDTTNGQSFVTCVYSGERKVFDEPFDWTAVGYSREHSYCHSWMPTYPCDNPEQPEYSDQHNLYPTNLQQANTPRSNLPLMDIDGNIVFTYLEGSVGYSGNQLVYEPRAAQKGNAARSIFYMATAYNSQGGNNWQIPANQSQESLKTWHYNDLPDNYEIARNEFIFGKQANRNPYVDSINFVCHVNFANMSYVTCDAGINEKLAANFTVFPVPASGKLFAQVNGLEIVEYTITDMQGRVIKSSSNVQVPVLEIETTEFKTGVYILQVGTTFGQVQREFIIE
jgi:hypothetical protein